MKLSTVQQLKYDNKIINVSKNVERNESNNEQITVYKQVFTGLVGETPLECLIERIMSNLHPILITDI